MKKIISILCLMSILMQCVIVAQAEDSNTITEQMETIYQLGIMADVNQSNEEVTRSDFAEMVCNLLYGKANITVATKSYYQDVDVYHYAAAPIQMLTEHGITQGYADGNFYPERNIAVHEAVTMILRAVGYEFLLSSGESVQSIASKAGIGKGLNFGANLTKETAAEIIFDALYADTMQTSLTENVVSRGDIVMSEFLGLQYKDGVVDGVCGKSLYDHFVHEGTVSIDETKYTITCKVDESLLGKYVRFYYNEEDDVVRAIVPKKNTILVIEADSIIDADNSKITYKTQNDKEKTIRINDGADLLYNGLVINDLSLYLPQNGEIKLIDRGDDGSYDVVFVSEYTSYLVSRTSVYDEKITLYNTPESINLKTYDKYEIVDQNNVQLKLDAITPNVVISVYKAGTKHIKIVKSDETVTGMITEVWLDDDGRTVITVGERQITLYSHCYFGGISLSAGANVTVHLDAFGIGTAIQTEKKDDWQFGYLIAARYMPGLESSVHLKVLTASGEQKVFNLVDKTKIDDDKKTPEVAITYLNNAFHNFDDEIEGGEEYKKELVTTRLMRYKSDGDIITQLDTPIKYGLYEESNQPEMTQSDKLLLRVKGNLYIPENKRGFKAVYTDYTDLQGEVFYTESTPVFVIPTVENTEADEEDYTVITGKELLSTYGEFVYMSSYYTDINSFVPVAIVVRKDTFKSSDTRLLVVNAIKKVWDEDEDAVVTQIEGYINGSLTAMTVDENNSSMSVVTLKQGDCIAYDMYNQKLRLTQMIYRADGGGTLNDNYFWSKNNESLFNVSFRAIIGRAGAINGSYMHLKIDSESKIDELIELPSNIAFFDSSKPTKSIHMGDSSGISANDIVIVSSRQGVQQDVIVIK